MAKIVQPLNNADLGILAGTLSYAVKRAYLRVIRDLEPALEPLGFTPPLLAALAIIGANPGIAPARLADAMGHGRSRAAPLVDALEALGHVTRGPGADRRSLELHTTARGEAMLASLAGLLAAHEARILGGMPAAEVRALAQRLTRIADGG